MVDLTIKVDPYGVVAKMDPVERRRLLIHLLGEFVGSETLDSTELQTVRRAVRLINAHAQYRFSTTNIGLSDEILRKLNWD
ncbi:hypothetical protein M1116_03480 [Patescibacteria group bacterium]|nr:hypothetical protein [Patescibacteria group bacterium]